GWWYGPALPRPRVWTDGARPARALAVPDTGVPPPGLSAVEADQVELFATLGWRAGLWLPLAVSGHAFGALSVGWARARSGAEADRMLAGERAGEVALAVRNADLVRRLADTDRRKDEFLSILAHELRNPLGAIQQAAEVLRAQVPPGTKSPPAAGMIDRQVRRIAHLVDDLLDVSRIGRGKLRIDPDAVNLSDAAAAAADGIRPSANGLDVRTEVPVDPVWVRADPRRLDQILTNLLTNAVKYTDAGGMVTVRVD